MNDDDQILRDLYALKRGDTSTTVVKSHEESRYLLLVAYSANKMPRRGADKRIDIASPSALEKACWKFAQNGFKVGLFHKERDPETRVVENFVHRGKPMRFVGPDGAEQVVRRGDWCVGLICSPRTWQLFKSGQIGGASPQGRAGRKPASKKTLARMRE